MKDKPNGTSNTPRINKELIKILERKGLITQDEILAEVEVLKKEMEEKIRRMGRENWVSKIISYALIIRISIKESVK